MKFTNFSPSGLLIYTADNETCWNLSMNVYDLCKSYRIVNPYNVTILEKNFEKTWIFSKSSGKYKHCENLVPYYDSVKFIQNHESHDKTVRLDRSGVNEPWC